MPCLAQNAGKKYMFKEIHWTITLPEDFKTFRSVADDVDIEREKANSKGDHANGGVPVVKTLISAMKEANVFNAGIAVAQSNSNENGRRAFEKSYNEYKKNDKIALDSSTTAESIDGVIFVKYQLTVRNNGKISSRMVWLSTQYNGYHLSITYLYSSKEAKDEIETMLKNSSFGKL
jgi:hypothetical protein